MPSPDTGEKALRELSRVHAAQLAAYAAARLKLQRPDLLTPRDRAHLAAADAALAENPRLVAETEQWGGRACPGTKELSAQRSFVVFFR